MVRLLDKAGELYSNVLTTHIVVNHGLTVEDIRTMFRTSHDFFALPDEIKAHTPMDKSRNAGWEKLAQVSKKKKKSF